MCRLILKYNTTEDHTHDQEYTRVGQTTDGTMVYMLVGIGIAVVVIPGIIISVIVVYKKKKESNGEKKTIIGGNQN